MVLTKLKTWCTFWHLKGDYVMPTCVCQVCGKRFDTLRHAGHWCSDDCRMRRNSMEKPVTWSVVCKGCGAVFETNNGNITYCSSNCPGRHRLEPVRTLTCSDCGKEFTSIGRRPRQRCVECTKKHKSLLTMQNRQRKNPEIQIGIGSGRGQHWKRVSDNSEESHDRRLAVRRKRYYERKLDKGCSGFTRNVYRRIAIAMHGARCCFCGYSDFPEAIETHHRDMDRTNNNKDNLFVLCSNCHRIIHNRISKGLRNHNATEVEGKQFVEIIFDSTKAEVKQRKKSGTSSMSQSDLKADRNVSQGQSIPAGEELLSADTSPLQRSQLGLCL